MTEPHQSEAAAEWEAGDSPQHSSDSEPLRGSHTHSALEHLQPSKAKHWEICLHLPEQSQGIAQPSLCPSAPCKQKQHRKKVYWKSEAIHTALTLCDVADMPLHRREDF